MNIKLFTCTLAFGALFFAACSDILPGPRNCSGGDSTRNHHHRPCTADSTATGTTAVVNP